MPDQYDLADDLLRGGEAIAEEIYGKAADAKKQRAAKRRLYNEWDRWPVWNENGTLFALRSRLRAHAAAKSGEAEARLSVAAATKKTKVPRRRKRAALSQNAAA